MASRIPELNDKEWLKDAYTIYSAASIASKLGCGTTTVGRALKQFGIMNRLGRNRSAIWRDPELFAEAVSLYRSPMSLGAVSQKLHIATSTLYNAFKANGVERRERGVIPAEPTPCPICGKPAPGTRQYCRSECAKIGRREKYRKHGPKLFRIPELNNKEWLERAYATQTMVAIANDLDCSLSHVYVALRTHEIEKRGRLPGTSSGKESHSWKGGKLQLECAWCEGPVKRHPGQIPESGYVFCNPKHRGLWDSANRVKQIVKTIHPKLTCENCGREFEVFLCDGDRKFCNHKRCYAEYRSKHYRGDKVHNWQGGSGERNHWQSTKEGKSFKRNCRKRDAYTCQRCGEGFSKHSNDLHVHHKAAFAKYAELRSEVANGICLCDECHYWTTSNEGTLVRLRWEQEALAELGHLLEPTATPAAS